MPGKQLLLYVRNDKNMREMSGHDFLEQLMQGCATFLLIFFTLDGFVPVATVSESFSIPVNITSLCFGYQLYT